jgi:hypothetical protein
VELTTIKDWSIVVAGIIALVTFAAATLESIRRGKQERAQNFVQMRRRFLETPQYREILDLLPSDDPRLAEISIQERRNFIGFLEEVALMVNSRLIRKEVAHYMFGHYVLLTHRSKNIWSNLDPKSGYWSVFRSFAEQMDRLEAMQRREPNKLSL